MPSDMNGPIAQPVQHYGADISVADGMLVASTPKIDQVIQSYYAEVV